MLSSQKELITVVRGDDGYIDHLSKIGRLPRKERNKFMWQKGLRAEIEAKCSGSYEYKNMWPVGTTLVCEKGEGFTIDVYEPGCSEYPDAVMVFGVTEIRDEKVREKFTTDKSRIGNAMQRARTLFKGFREEARFLLGGCSNLFCCGSCID